MKDNFININGIILNLTKVFSIILQKENDMYTGLEVRFTNTVYDSDTIFYKFENPISLEDYNKFFDELGDYGISGFTVI